MSIQPKKSFALVEYTICDPTKCNPDVGLCAAVSACSHTVIKQLDGVFEPPIVFQDMCLGCLDCVEACQLDAVHMKHIA